MIGNAPDPLIDLQDQIYEWWEEAQRARPEWYGGYPCPQLSSNVGVVDAHSFLDGLRADPPIFSIERGYVLRTPLPVECGSCSNPTETSLTIQARRPCRTPSNRRAALVWNLE